MPALLLPSHSSHLCFIRGACTIAAHLNTVGSNCSTSAGGCTTESEEQIERIPASFGMEVLFHTPSSSNSPGMPFSLIGVIVLFISYQTVINPLWKGIKTNKRLLPIKQSMMAKKPVVKTMKMVGSAKLKVKD